MVDDLLDMDRIERGILSPNLSPTDVPALVRGIVEEIDLNGRPVRVEGEEITAMIDPPKVERIVENLVTNAIKYTPPDTAIDLQVCSQDDGVLITVDDHGPGIADELKTKVFEAFQRGPEAPNKAKGSGVGLSLVTRFAELHGGRAWVEDRPGGGASFRVFLPDGRVAAVAIAEA
jgi:signal transduction histidine kinase